MKAGRELDALIAEKVMEHKVIRKGEEFTGFPLLLHSSGDWETGIAKEDIWQIGERSYSPFSLPHYSTQIADAWLVAEKLELPFTLQKNKQFKGGHYASFIVDKKFKAAQAATAPLAICLAALEAIA